MPNCKSPRPILSLCSEKLQKRRKNHGYRAKRSGGTCLCRASPGVPVFFDGLKLTDLMLMADDLQKLEDDRNLLRRSFASAGSAALCDWQAVNIMLFRRLNDRSLPATQAELVSDVQDCFAQHTSSGEIPEESMTRKKIVPIWRALREPA